jgi:endoglucanase
MLLQVGIGSGNKAGTFSGDHDLWRLPEKDDALKGAANRYLRDRPVFRANAPGKPVPPNLAGRVSAAFALAAQLDAATQPERARSELATAAAIFGAARTSDVKDVA